MSRSIYVGIPLLIALTVLQAAVLPHLRVAGVTPQLAIVAVLCWVQLRNAYEGLIWAFIAGFLLDLFSSGPMGATALALMVAVLVIVRLQRSLPENPFLLPILFSGLGFAVYLLLYVGIGRVAGYGFTWRTLSALPQMTLLHAALGLPLYWLLYMLARALYPRPIEG